jgi:hypothetical protein
VTLPSRALLFPVAGACTGRFAADINVIFINGIFTVIPR